MTDLNELLDARMQTAMVFAARYTYDRPTGATFAVVCALQSCWPQLTKRTQEQILDESKRATCNQVFWEQLRVFASKK